MKLDLSNRVGATASEADERSIERLFVKEFGVSSNEFERQLAAEFALATPEEQAELERAIDEANAVLREMNASLDRIGKHVATMRIALDEMQNSVASMAVRLDGIEDKLAADGKQ
jgi:predicted  nucleic acid-binding Zn-ribbon protein